MKTIYLSSCICKKNKLSKFEKVIEYKNEKIIKYNGIIIGKCISCGILKTIPQNKNVKFNPQKSDVKEYEKNKQQFRKIFSPIIKLISKYKQKGCVLDVGCSSGILLDMLEERGFDVYGIEPNITAFKAIYKKYNNRIFNGTLRKYIKKRALRYDVVIYNHVFEHIKQPLLELALIKKTLKKDGILFLGVPNTSNLIFWWRKKNWNFLVPDQHIWHFSKSYLINLLEKGGFKILYVECADSMIENTSFIKRNCYMLLSLVHRLFGMGEGVRMVITLNN